jgi:hypothetical protein
MDDYLDDVIDENPQQILHELNDNFKQMAQNLIRDFTEAVTGKEKDGTN